MRALFVAALFMSLTARAAPLCSGAAQPNGEGAKPVAETSFTEQAARRELKKLRAMLGPEGLKADPAAWETSFFYLEGWYLKRQALKARGGNGPAYAISDFCDFIRDRAYAR